MPQKRNSAPPPVMTWMRALPVLVVAGIFDLLRLFFEWFWFLGPALAGVICSIKVSGALQTWTAGALGTKTAAALCGAGATVVGYAGAPAIEAFGVVMAIAVGLAGWMTVGLILIKTNARIFKENEGHVLWFVVSLAVSEMPIIGSLPALTGTLWKMYGTQIKKDKETLKKYTVEQTRSAQLAEAGLY